MKWWVTALMYLTMPTDPATPLSPQHQTTLLALAHQAIAAQAARGDILMVNEAGYPAALQPKRATFVTLTLSGQLRGCMGTLEAHRPLVVDVAHNARAAAFSDPRFPAVTITEAEQLHLHIAVLHPAEAIEFASEQDLIHQLRPGLDGLILEEHSCRSTFLPSVWATLPNPTQFLLHLKRKAGLPANYWSKTITAWRYTATSFGDPEPPSI